MELQNAPNLSNVFQATLDCDPSVRALAEAQLLRSREDGGFLFACLDMTLMGSDPAIAQAAALYLKNTVFCTWVPPQLGHSTPINNQGSAAASSLPSPVTSSPVVVTPKLGGGLLPLDTTGQTGKLAGGPLSPLGVNAPLFKHKLLKTIVSAQPLTLPHLVTTVSFLIAAEPFPQAWPELLPTISQLLTVEAPSPSDILGAVLCLIEVLRYYRWRLNTEEGRKSLCQVVSAFFPYLLQIGTSLVQEQPSGHVKAAGEILWKILKAYKLATMAELIPFFQQRDQLERWINLFLWVIQNDIQNDGCADNVRVWQKCRKWAFDNMNRLLMRYSLRPNAGDEEIVVSIMGNYQEFSNMFLTVFAPEITRQYINQVQQYAEGKRITDKHSIKSIVTFFENCVQVESLWTIIFAHLELILSKFIFTTLRLSDDDINSFKYEPDQFIYTQLEYDDESRSTPQAATRALLKSLAQRRQNAVLPGILMFINGVMEKQHHNQQDFALSLDKDSGLQIMCAISDYSKASPIIQEQMEEFIKTYVLPDFDSSHSFLRARACQLITCYSDVTLTNDTLERVYQQVLKCLDSLELVVKLKATLALQALLRFDSVRANQAYNIQHTMEKVLQLYDNDVSSDIISNVMEDLVSKFSKELIPFASKLCQQLADQFLRILQELTDGERQQAGPIDYAYLDDKADSAQGILGTLSTLLYSLQDYGEEVDKLEDSLIPIIKPVFENSHVDLYADIFEIIDAIILTNKRVSSTLWGAFDVLLASFHQEPENCVDELILCLSNFIAYGPQDIDKDRAHRVFEVIHFAIAQPDIQPSTKNNAASVGQLMVLTLSSVGELIPHFVEAVYQFDTGSRQMVNLVAAVIFHDPFTGLSTLNRLVALSRFLDQWIPVVFTNRYEMRLNIASLLKVLAVKNGVPAVYLPRILHKALNMMMALQGQAQPQVTFEIVDETGLYGSHTWGGDGENLPALEPVLDGIDLQDLYIQSMKYMSMVDVKNYQLLVDSLNEKQRGIHFAFMG
jgi:hypothetical protein